jgi:hypothetical protein
MRHYTELATYQRSGFEVIVDKTWEDIAVGDCFDDTCYDIQELERKIENGTYDWFMLRVRVLVDGHELGSNYLGGCLYEDAREVLTDGMAEDCIEQAIEEAKAEVSRLAGKLWALQLEIEGAPL